MPTCPFCAKPVPADSSVCPHCLRGLPVAPSRRKPHGPLAFMHGRWRLIVLLLLLGAVGYAYRERRGITIPRFSLAPDREADPDDVPAPATQIVQTTVAPPLDLRIIDTASVKVEADRYLAYPFSGDDRSRCHVLGSLRVLSGGDRRVNVFVVDRDGLAELEGGGTPRTYYESGPSAAAELDIKLDGRSAYTLVVSNLGKRSRAKTVRLQNVRAECSD